MSFLYRLVIGIIAVWLTVQLGQMMGVGLAWHGVVGAFVFVIVLAVVNAVIRPIVKLITLPLTCLTFGLFAFVVNALLFWGVAAATDGIVVKNFLAALFGSVVLTIVSGIMNSFVKTRSES